jgi:DNA replication licensing factor MCM6
LRQSIISVEKDDVEVDEDEEEIVGRNGTNGPRRDTDGDSPMADADDDDGDNGPDGGAGPSAAAPAAANDEKKKTKITYDKYISVVNLLVQRVNEDELSNGEGVGGETLVEWYLEQKENDLNGEADYHAEMALTKKIIKRMVKVRFSSPLILSQY